MSTRTVAERLRERMDALQLKAVDLARLIGIKPPSLQLWLDGTTKHIKGENLLKAAAVLNVNAEWLQSGRGPKFPGEESSGQRAPTMQEPSPTPYVSSLRQLMTRDDALIAEALELLLTLPAPDREEAVSFLRVFASKHTAPNHRGANLSVPGQKTA